MLRLFGFCIGCLRFDVWVVLGLDVGWLWCCISFWFGFVVGGFGGCFVVHVGCCWVLVVLLFSDCIYVCMLLLDVGCFVVWMIIDVWLFGFG